MCEKRPMLELKGVGKTFNRGSVNEKVALEEEKLRKNEALLEEARRRLSLL